MEPTTIAAGASVLGGLMGYKGNMSAARSAQAVGEYNAQVAENEAILLARQTRDHERNLRINSERIKAKQRIMTAAAGVQMSGSPLQALADTYFSTEEDAARIRAAGDVAQMQKISEAALQRTQGAARATASRYAAYGSLLTGATQAAQSYDLA